MVLRTLDQRFTARQRKMSAISPCQNSDTNGDTYRGFRFLDFSSDSPVFIREEARNGEEIRFAEFSRKMRKPLETATIVANEVLAGGKMKHFISLFH